MLLKLPQSMLVLWARVHWPRGRRRRRKNSDYHFIECKFSLSDVSIIRTRRVTTFIIVILWFTSYYKIIDKEPWSKFLADERTLKRCIFVLIVD